jgi:hypothetical protein
MSRWNGESIGVVIVLAFLMFVRLIQHPWRQRSA